VRNPCDGIGEVFGGGCVAGKGFVFPVLLYGLLKFITTLFEGEDAVPNTELTLKLVMKGEVFE
jgi:hypothetical protein